MDGDYSPQGQKESNTTEATQFTPTRMQTRAHGLLLKWTDRKGRANAAGTSLIPLSSMPGLDQLTRPVTDRPHLPSPVSGCPSWWGVTTSQVYIFRILREKKTQLELRVMGFSKATMFLKVRCSLIHSFIQQTWLIYPLSPLLIS